MPTLITGLSLPEAHTVKLGQIIRITE